MAFIPLISLYGLSVCPILHVSGFFLGCGYASVYIIVSLILNYSLIFYYSKNSNTNLIKYKEIIFFSSYILSSVLALVALTILFKINHISAASRAPEVLFFASVLLGITQSNGLNWALQIESESNESSSNSQQKFVNYWLSHISRLLLPIAALVLVLMDFLFRNSFSLNKGVVAQQIDSDELIKQASTLILFLIIWLCITYVFYFLAEKDQVKKVEVHLENLKNLNLNYKSSIQNSWGLWKAFLNQLNDFTQVFSERSRLLKNFSRFVTKSVAQEALTIELKQSVGVTKEMTVIMTDIRQFTNISNQLDAEKVVLFLNEYFSVMLDVFNKNHIVVDKFIGDGILAYVDSDELGQDESKINNYAVKASIEMHSELLKLNEKFKQMNLPSIKMGVGIYRGPLVIGYIGAQDKIQHTIVGDTVNKAARLEGMCKELTAKTIITEKIFKTLNNEMQKLFKYAGKPQIRGVKEEIDLYTIEA